MKRVLDTIGIALMLGAGAVLLWAPVWLGYYLSR